MLEKKICKCSREPESLHFCAVSVTQTIFFCDVVDDEKKLKTKKSRKTYYEVR